MTDPKPPDEAARSFPEIAFAELLRAHAAATSELNLPMVLDNVVAAARTLAGARTAVLTVRGDDGELRRFTRAGPDDDVSGAGSTPGPDGVLTVPVTANGQVVGTLQLADPTCGSFTDEHEQLAAALAAVAGTAIHNARRCEDAERRQRWQTAATEVSQELFARPSDDVWRVVLRHASAAARGGSVAVALPAGEPAVFTISHADGPTRDRLAGAAFRLEPAAASTVLRDVMPVAVQASSLAAMDGPPVSAVAQSIVLAPVQRAGRVVAVLAVTAAEDAPLPTADAEQVGRFAGHVAVALELATARADEERVRRLGDQERIAADLNDVVVTDLFAAGMTLEALVPFLPAGDGRRVSAAVDAIDRSIKQIRTAVFRSQTNGEPQ